MWESLSINVKEIGYTVAVTSRDMSRLESMPEGIYKIESQLDSSDTCEKAIQTAIEYDGLSGCFSK